MANWITGAIMGLISLAGLFLASRAHDGMFYFFGLLVFAFGVFFIFGMIARATAHPASHDLGEH